MRYREDDRGIMTNREGEAMDRYITGNYGEDSVRGTCYFGTPECEGELWECETCGEWFCELHFHETSKGRNVECVGCERERKEAENNEQSDPMTDNEFAVVNRGNCCPFCRSFEHYPKGDYKEDNGYVWRKSECGNCDGEWTSVYALKWYQ